MASNSSIEWTDATWNPITGCTKISPGCKNCYAERMAIRLQAKTTSVKGRLFKAEGRLHTTYREAVTFHSPGSPRSGAPWVYEQ